MPPKAKKSQEMKSDPNHVFSEGDIVRRRALALPTPPYGRPPRVRGGRACVRARRGWNTDCDVVHVAVQVLGKVKGYPNWPGQVRPLRLSSAPQAPSRAPSMHPPTHTQHVTYSTTSFDCAILDPIRVSAWEKGGRLTPLVSLLPVSLRTYRKKQIVKHDSAPPRVQKEKPPKGKNLNLVQFFTAGD